MAFVRLVLLRAVLIFSYASEAEIKGTRMEQSKSIALKPKFNAVYLKFGALGVHFFAENEYILGQGGWSKRHIFISVMLLKFGGFTKT